MTPDKRVKTYHRGQVPLTVCPIHLRGRTAVSNEIGLISGRSASGNAAGPGHDNRILIFESILIYQHFHSEPLTFILNLLPSS